MADFIKIKYIDAILNLRSGIKSAVSDLYGDISRLYSALSDVQMQADEALEEGTDKLDEAQRELDDELRELSAIEDRLNVAERNRNRDDQDSEDMYDYWVSRYNAQLEIVQEKEHKVRQIEDIVSTMAACKSKLDAKGSQLRVFASKYRMDMDDAADNAGSVLLEFAQDINDTKGNFNKNIL